MSFHQHKATTRNATHSPAFRSPLTPPYGICPSMLFPAEQDWEGTQNLWNFRYDCPAAYKENLQTLHDNQQKAAGSNIKVLEDAIGALLQKNPAKSLHRYTGKNSQGEQDASKLSTDFGDISNDIALSLPDGIPIEVREAFDCACAEATKDVPGISCPTLKSSKTQLGSPNPLRKDLDTVFQALDKGSSDCRRPASMVRSSHNRRDGGRH